MMRFWRRLRDRGLTDFADAIRPELREVPAPKAREELLTRILASRSAGARVILPHEESRKTASPLRYAGTIAAAVVALLIGSTLLDRRTGPDDVASAPSWFARAAFAQTPPDVMPSARVTAPERLHPFTIRYARTVAGAQPTYLDVDMRRASVGSVPAWRLVSTRRRTGSIDTVHIAADDLRLLRVVAHVAPYSRFSDIRVAQTIEGLRVYGDMNADQKQGDDPHRTFDRQLPSSRAPYVTDAMAPMYLMGVELSAGWKGRVSVLGWAVRNDDISTSVEMRVDGEEVVRVPAGEFDCWRLIVDVPGERQLYWVRKNDGLGVMSRVDGKNAREIVLLSERL